MNYKRIPFDVVWVDFPDVERTAKALNAEHTRVLPDGTKEYTVPIVTFKQPNQETVVVSDSERVANYLDGAFPDPDRMLFPKETLVFQHTFQQFFRREAKVPRAFLRVNITSILDALPPHTRQWWIETRPRAFGDSYDALAPNTTEKRAMAWKAYEDAFDAVAKYFDVAGEGNHRLSAGLVTFAEIELVSLLKTIQFIGKDDGWKGLKDRNGGRWAKLVNEPEYRYVTSTAVAMGSKL